MYREKKERNKKQTHLSDRGTSGPNITICGKDKIFLRILTNL